MSKVHTVIEVIEGCPAVSTFLKREKAEKHIKELVKEHLSGQGIKKSVISESVKQTIQNGEYQDDFGYGIFHTITDLL